MATSQGPVSSKRITTLPPEPRRYKILGDFWCVEAAPSSNLLRHLWRGAGPHWDLSGHKRCEMQVLPLSGCSLLFRQKESSQEGAWEGEAAKG